MLILCFQCNYQINAQTTISYGIWYFYFYFIVYINRIVVFGIQQSNRGEKNIAE